MNIADILKVIQGWVKIKGATDGTFIGNNLDALKISIQDPELGVNSLVAPNGVLHVASLVRLVGDNFIDGKVLLPTIWSTSVANGGTITTVDGELNLNTNTAADGAVNVETLRPARFITGTFNISHQAISTPDVGNADVVRQFGCFDPTDGSNNGVYWENDSGAWTINRLKNGVVVETIASASFTNTADFISDGNIHIYEIMYNAGTIFFLQDRKFIHRISSLSSAAYGTAHLKCGHKLFNKNGNTVNNMLLSRGSSIGRIGSSDSIPNFIYIDVTGVTVIKNSPGKLHKILITDNGTGSSSINVFNNDANSGEIIGVLDNNDVDGELEYNVEFDVGLTIEVLGNNVKLTVVCD